MEEFGLTVIVIIMLTILIGSGWMMGRIPHHLFLNQYECRDERVVDHLVRCYRYDLKET